MKTIVSLFHNKVFKFGLLFALFVTAALIAIAMILGKESGYFTIRVQNGDALKSIALALDPANEKEYTTGYDAKAIDDFDQTSPTYLFAEKNGKSFAAIDDLHNATPGDINLEKTYGYSFYIMNTTSNFQDVTVRLKLTMSKDDGLSDAIRVMTYYTSDDVQNFRVYQKTDTISTTSRIKQSDTVSTERLVGQQRRKSRQFISTSNMSRINGVRIPKADQRSRG